MATVPGCNAIHWRTNRLTAKLYIRRILKVMKE
jgi:hypothetical protein